MARNARRVATRVTILAGCLAVAVVLTGCLPPAPRTRTTGPAPGPPPSTTAPATTPSPSPARLVVLPASVNLTAERTAQPHVVDQKITVTNVGDVPSGAIGAVDLAGLAEPGMGAVVTSEFSLGSDDCSGQVLAAGASCDVWLDFGAWAYANSAPWTGDLPIAATPGGTAHVSVTARYTSRLEFDTSATLTATQNPPTDGSTHLTFTNASTQDFVRADFGLMPVDGVGDFARGIDPGFAGLPACADGMVLPAGTSCQWLVTYANATGADAGHALLGIVVWDDQNRAVLSAAAELTGEGRP